AGAVVTGTLGGGTLRPDDALVVVGERGARNVTIRGLQSHDAAVDGLTPVTRAAVNLRGAAADTLRRGDVLLTPGAWTLTDTVDVRELTCVPHDHATPEPPVHVGTVAIPARVRPLGDRHARLTPARALPLTLGDRMMLRSPGSRAVFAGVQVLDVDPPALTRRGDGRRRGEALTHMSPE